jgi:hypothetical protein
MPALKVIKQSWKDVEHLSDCELRIMRSNGSIDDYWRLDLENKNLVPFKDHNGRIVEYGVYLYAFMNLEYPRESKIRPISELLKLNS